MVRATDWSRRDRNSLRWGQSNVNWARTHVVLGYTCTGQRGAVNSGTDSRVLQGFCVPHHRSPYDYRLAEVHILCRQACARQRPEPTSETPCPPRFLRPTNSIPDRRFRPLAGLYVARKFRQIADIGGGHAIIVVFRAISPQPRVVERTFGWLSNIAAVSATTRPAPMVAM